MPASGMAPANSRWYQSEGARPGRPGCETMGRSVFPWTFAGRGPGRILLAGLALSLGAPAASSGQTRGAAGYEARVQRYRSGDFVGAIRDSMELSQDDLEDDARVYLRGFTGRSASQDLTLLAAALFHLDLAGPAGVDPEDNEEIARRFLDQITEPQRAEWLRETHLGLLGFHATRSRWPDAVRVAIELGERFDEDRTVALAGAWLAEALGWGYHDERFLDQAQFVYVGLLTPPEGEAPAPDDEAPDPVELRLRLGHLTLREGNPESALELLEAPDGYPNALFRFVAGVLRGETLLWLGRAQEAEQAFAEAHAVHSGSVSAAAGLAAARQMLGDSPGAAQTARRFLADTDGEDACDGSCSAA